ncbi:MAG: PAC2 family protein [Actinomycetes bacterium]
MDIVNIPALRAPVMIAAFGGWNDAGSAASFALDHLISLWPSTVIAHVDSEDFYDFQVNRPTVSLDDHQKRYLTWPGTQIVGLSTPHLNFDIVIVKGVEPSMRWKKFANDILDIADDLEISLIITLGSLLADTPHSRPISVSATGANPEIAQRLGVETSKYEGPTGILGVLQDGAQRRGMDAISLWSAVPHYAPNSPSPKASLALINALEDFLNISIPQGDLPTQSQNWEIDVDELAREDNEISEYVRALEESKDAADLPSATGDAIAREFERYLRRRSTE